METPARDALLKLSSNASLTWDASAPQELTDQQKQELEKDQELMSLKRECKAFCDNLIAEYHQLHRARGTELYKEFQKLQNKVRAKRKKNHESAKRKHYSESFENIGNQIIEQNYQGKPIKFEPNVSHVIPERKALADLEFKNQDVDTVNDAELLEDHIQSLELRLALHKLNVPKPLQKQIKFNDSSADKPPETVIPMKSKSGLECPVCLGHSNVHLRVRRYTYAHKDTLQKHFKTHKLPKNFPEGRECNYPSCVAVLSSLPQYKFHQIKEHKIPL